MNLFCFQCNVNSFRSSSNICVHHYISTVQTQNPCFFLWSFCVWKKFAVSTSKTTLLFSFNCYLLWYCQKKIPENNNNNPYNCWASNALRQSSKLFNACLMAPLYISQAIYLRWSLSALKIKKKKHQQKSV